MFFTELVAGLDDLVVAAILTHSLRGKIRMAARTIPITRNRLRVPTHIHVEQFTNTEHQIARDPKLVAAIDADTGSHLVLPLASHHFCIDARDLHTSVKASSVMCLDNWAT